MFYKTENIFKLSYINYEEQRSYYLIGPEEISQEAFQKICDELVPHAAKLALQTILDGNPYQTYIGWPEITFYIVAILKERGFIEFLPKEAAENGSLIILNNSYRGNQRSYNNIKLGNMLETIQYYNQLIEEDKDWDEIKKIMKLQAFW